jgi:hypothetical protein
LREPWKAGRNAESGDIVYTRNFHLPTGAEAQSITLRIALLAEDQAGSSSMLSVLVNGRLLSAEVLSAVNPSDRALRFQLKELEAFNILELRISRTNGLTSTNGLEFDGDSPPIFGSFVIEAVELQID